MSLFGNFFNKRKLKKREQHADQQYLDALEIIKESMDIYLDLLAHARETEDDDMTDRLENKLNTDFEYLNKSWDGEVRIVHSINSSCTVIPGAKRLKIQ